MTKLTLSSISSKKYCLLTNFYLLHKICSFIGCIDFISRVFLIQKVLVVLKIAPNFFSTLWGTAL